MTFSSQAKPLLAAISFLTCFPVPKHLTFEAGDVSQASRFFPLVGALIAFFQLLLLGLLVSFETPPALLSAVLLTVALALVTGALHFDALADTTDGLGGGSTPDDALRIMRDPQLGSFGTLALILAVSLRIAALSALIEVGALAGWLIAATALSRWTPSLLSYFLPYARGSQDGLGKVLDTESSRAQLRVASAIAIVIAFFALGLQALAAILLVLVLSFLAGTLFERRIGGITGDTSGAVIEITELALLSLGVLMSQG